ncbi:MAG: hypothetical protein KDC38_04835, partial [Planctomycetes bacterium]|nr:hypothetical protein [Planctomycetota bacterium]
LVRGGEEGTPGSLAERAADRLVPGAILEVFDLGSTISRIPVLVPDQRPNVSKRVPSFALTSADTEISDYFLARIHGFLIVPKGGEYRFKLSSDDGSRLTIDDAMVIDNDGLHAFIAREGSVRLAAGRHPFVIEWFDAGGADRLDLEWAAPKRRFEPIPTSAIASSADHDHSTTSGWKQIQIDRRMLDHLDEQERIEKAIDDGVAFLLRELDREPIGAEGQNAEGQLALEIYALIVAGVSVDDPRVDAGFEYLKKNLLGGSGQRNTYALSCAIFAYDAAIAQLEYDVLILSPPKARDKVIDNPAIGKQYRKWLKSAIDLLLRNQRKSGGFRYTKNDKDEDNSCSQFAALAFGVAEKRGERIPVESWTKLANYFLGQQMTEGRETPLRLTPYGPGESHRGGLTLVSGEEGTDDEPGKSDRGDGKKTGVAEKPKEWDPIIGTEGRTLLVRGWGYQEPSHPTWNMSCSGVSSLLLVRKYARSVFDEATRVKLSAAIRDGFGWLMERWTPTSSYYGIYSIEKVADIGGVKLFADRDWYEEVSDYLVHQQLKGGEWPDGRSHGENPRVTTSFALLVLNRATMLLTANPAERVIITGGTSEERRALGREWVYIQDLDTCLHVPQLFRTIRMRPQRRLIEFLETVVRSYEEEYRHELVEGLLEIRRLVDSKAVRKLVGEALAEIVGHECDSDDDYRQWRDHVVRAIAIAEGRESASQLGEEGDEDGAPPVEEADIEHEILELYRAAAGSLALKRHVIQAALRRNLRALTPLLIDDLDDASSDLRARVYRAIRVLNGDGVPPFDGHEEPEARARRIAAIREWWSRVASGS